MAALAISGHEQMAHARMLEERPTAASGELLSVDDGLDLLQNGQLVNLAVGPDAAPGRILSGSTITPSAAEIAAELGRSLGVPSELILDGKQGDETEISAAEVLAINSGQQEVVLGLDALPHGVREGYPAVLDLTDAGGTYYLAGEITFAGGDEDGGRPRLTMRVRQTSLVQLRRFVRVPVLISPYALEVQSAPGRWHPVRGEIVDLSLGGLGLIVDEPLLGESHVRLRFELPGRFGELAVSGRVVEPPGPAEAQSDHRRGAGLAHRRGVSLDPLTIDDLRNLQRALYHRQVELRRLSDPLPRRSRTDSRATTRPPFWRFWRR